MRGKHCMTLSAAFALLLTVIAGIAQAGPRPLPPNANEYGVGYAGLTAAWLEWTVAVPESSNPILDSDGAFATAGQSGRVWFLTGTLGGAATRDVTIPAGTSLFFPIVNYFWVNTPEYGDAPWSPDQEAFVRQLMADTVDTAQNMSLEVDGRPIPNLATLRVSGAVGACTLPDDNIFEVPFEPVPHDCVADGYWALLSPLSVGTHTIHFAGGFESGFSLDVTYHITVTAR